MTDQADALAVLIRVWHNGQRYRSCCPDRTCEACSADLALHVRAHFAEEIARAEQAEQRYRNACEALRIETEEADALERKLEQAEAALARVREGLTRERLAEVMDEVWSRYASENFREHDMTLAMADAIRALLAPEGK